MANYPKAAKYPDLDAVYAQCSGPGGLKLAEFLGDKMQLQPGQRVLDVGMNRGYQTCFLAKEYEVSMVGIDPWNDRDDKRPHIDHLMDNAMTWCVQDAVLGVQTGVPDSKLPSGVFDAVYSTTALEMVRGIEGEQAYQACLMEIYRLLRPGGVFGLAEPMHLDVPIPKEIVSQVTKGDHPWTKFFVTIGETRSAVKAAGFQIVEAAYAPDAYIWWLEYAQYDPFCKAGMGDERYIIRTDRGRWLSLGYVITRKP